MQVLWLLLGATAGLVELGMGELNSAGVAGRPKKNSAAGSPKILYHGDPSLLHASERPAPEESVELCAVPFALIPPGQFQGMCWYRIIYDVCKAIQRLVFSVLGASRPMSP